MLRSSSVGRVKTTIGILLSLSMVCSIWLFVYVKVATGGPQQCVMSSEDPPDSQFYGDAGQSTSAASRAGGRFATNIAFHHIYLKTAYIANEIGAKRSVFSKKNSGVSSGELMGCRRRPRLPVGSQRPIFAYISPIIYTDHIGKGKNRVMFVLVGGVLIHIFTRLGKISSSVCVL